MSVSILRFALFTLAVGAGNALGQTVPPTPGTPLSPQAANALAGNLRSLLMAALPVPLYVDDSHWGGQKPVSGRIRLTRINGRLRPEAEKKLKNDGAWWKVVVTADRPAETLAVEVRDLRLTEPGKLTFVLLLSLPANVDYDKQKWREGVRIWSAGVRARGRIILKLNCEVAANFQRGNWLLPEAIFRLRVLGSECGYDNLVVEHVAGLGGDAAKVLGNSLLRNLHRWRPSLERRLLDKANAAIVKAGDTKEVRIGLYGLMK